MALGERFISRVLPDSSASVEGPPIFAQVVASAHGVVTADLVEEEGQPAVL
jgi:hypothetical protein